MAKVFLAEKNSKYNLSSANKFGKLVFLSEEQLNPFNTAEIAALFITGLQQFNPKVDFVCLTGASSVICIFLAVAVKLYGSVKILMFDARETQYRERIIDI